MAKSLREILTRRHNEAGIMKQLGYQRNLNPDNSLLVTIPSLPFEAFENPGETILPWYIMRIFQSDYFVSYFPFSPEKVTQSKKKTVIYLAYHETEFDLSLYEEDSPKHPLLVETKWKYAKTCSRSSVALLRHPSRVKPYAKNEFVAVRVDPETRKPIPFPESWKVKYNIPSGGVKTEHIIPARTSTTHILTTEHRVSYSDLDGNGHANYSFYTRVCYNSFAENLVSGKLGSDAEIHFKNGLKKVQSTYLNESLIRDVVNVDSWKDDSLNNVYYFDVRKLETICARLTFTFYKHSASALSHRM